MNRFSVIANAPKFTKGFVKEMRVRWALEEMNLPYEEHRYEHAKLKEGDYLEKQPFGQVPYFESEGVTMFETGAILLHLALKHGQLLPADEVKRAEALTWHFASLTSLEPAVAHCTVVNFFCRGEEWAELRKPVALENLNKRLEAVSKAIGEREYLAGDFSIADISMTTVLRDAMGSKLLVNFPNLMAYKERNEARAGFKRALESHQQLYL